jgi:hypothetical protein
MNRAPPLRRRKLAPTEKLAPTQVLKNWPLTRWQQKNPKRKNYPRQFSLQLHQPFLPLVVVLEDVLDVLLHEELERRRRARPDERFAPGVDFIHQFQP